MLPSLFFVTRVYLLIPLMCEFIAFFAPDLSESFLVSFFICFARVFSRAPLASNSKSIAGSGAQGTFMTFATYSSQSLPAALIGTSIL